MVKKEHNLNLFSVIIGIIISIVGQGIYNVILDLVRDQTLDFITEFSVLALFAAFGIVLALAWLVREMIKKKPERVN
jgi:amino acid transporter